MLAEHLSGWNLPGKVVPPANWHLTVRFLGGVDETRREILLALLDQADLGGPFQIQLGPMGAFPRPAKAAVVWLGLSAGAGAHTELNLICEDAVQTAGLQAEERPYAPHLTLSRLRPPEDVSEPVASYQPVPFRWQATELVLYASRSGPVYHPLERFAL